MFETEIPERWKPVMDLRSDPLFNLLRGIFIGNFGREIVGYRAGTGTIVFLLKDYREKRNIPEGAVKIFGMRIRLNKVIVQKCKEKSIDYAVQELEKIAEFSKFAYLLVKPNFITRIHVRDGVLPIIFMKYYPWTLRDFIVNGVDETISLSLIAQVTFTLCRLHPVLEAHQDLKPENILIDRKLLINRDKRGHKLYLAYVSDFGLANAYKSLGISKGSWPYMAPEQHKGKVTKKTDSFSVAVMLTELLTGSHPIGKPTLELWNPLGKPRRRQLNGEEWKEWAESGERIACMDIDDSKLRTYIIKALSSDPSERPSMNELHICIMDVLRRIDISKAEEVERILVGFQKTFVEPGALKAGWDATKLIYKIRVGGIKKRGLPSLKERWKVNIIPITEEVLEKFSGLLKNV